MQTVFKSPPAIREVTAMCLGDKPGNQADKIYVAFGQTILGFKKKGTALPAFNTSLNEDIRNLVVEENTIWAACEFIYNVFENQRDTCFYMAPGEFVRAPSFP